MRGRNFFYPACLLLASTNLYATVGGEQTLEFLGYEPRDQKVYVLRHFHDGRGDLPKLYYYDFKNPTNQKSNTNKNDQSSSQTVFVEAESLYLNPQTGKIDYGGNQVAFEKELQKIKRRLRPLYPVNPNAFDLTISKTDEKAIPSWHDENQTIPEYHHEYQVHGGKYQSSVQKSVSYTPQISIEQAFRVPQQDKIVVSVVYLGIPFETGYTIEDPVLLEKK